MYGNVWEWCQDCYGAYSSSPETDPTEPASCWNRALRGGSFGAGAYGVRSANRGSGLSGGRNIGARLLRQGPEYPFVFSRLKLRYEVIPRDSAYNRGVACVGLGIRF